jgi:hypothetical protein
MCIDHTYIHTYTHTYILTLMDIDMCIDHTYIHTYTHTYILTLMDIDMCKINKTNTHKNAYMHTRAHTCIDV